MDKINFSRLKTILCCFLIGVSCVFCSQAQTDSLNKVKIKAVSASSCETKAAGGWADYLPEYAIDGDLSGKSSFRTEGHGEWIMFDLGELVAISHIKLKFLRGNERKYTIDIEISTDTTATWKKILEKKQSSGTTETFDSFDVNIKGQFIKVTGHGNTNVKFSEWLNIVEAEVYKR